jgi:hypothetical protein
MILGLVMDGAGWPVCTEMWPGNTADVTTLLPVRFSVGCICVVADRGMISAETIAGLEARGLDYILGAREHTDRLVPQIVLDDQAPFVPLAIDRRQGDTQLFVKEVKRAGVATSSAALRAKRRTTAPCARRSSLPLMPSSSAATKR